MWWIDTWSYIAKGREEKKGPEWSDEFNSTQHSISVMTVKRKFLSVGHKRCLVWFYGTTFVDYLTSNHVFTCILNIYDLLWFVFMAYQQL